VQDLAEIHYRSAELQRRADSVFIAIFVVLERIVDELSRNMASKLTLIPALKRKLTGCRKGGVINFQG
jgi:hypothetical protein